MDKPKRHIEFECKIGADSIKDLLAALNEIAGDLAANGSLNCAHGGPAAGYLVRTEINPSQDHDSYFVQIAEWNKHRKACLEPGGER